MTATLVACGESTTRDRDEPRPSPTGEVDEVQALLDEIAALPEADLQSLGVPETPPGHLEETTWALGDLLFEMMLDSFNNPAYWSAEEAVAVVAQVIAPLPDETRDHVFTYEIVKTGAVGPYLGSIFEPNVQPLGPPRILKAVWQTSVLEEDDPPQRQQVRLQMYAHYLVGDPDNPQSIFVVRQFDLMTSDVDHEPPGFGWDTVAINVAADDAHCEGAFRLADELSAESLLAFLNAVREPGWVDHDELSEVTFGHEDIDCLRPSN